MPKVITTSEYKRRVWIYKNRRDRSYETVKRLSAKIRQMEQCLSSKERREKKSNEKTDALIAGVNDFFGVDIRSAKVDKDHKLARNVYYKMGIELQIKEVVLCRKVNRRAKAASYGRSALIKSFKNCPENKKWFYNFKYFFNQKKSL